jgi:Domain of unknown function (DUF5916)/Carbohydrate family 9 binding domain-like
MKKTCFFGFIILCGLPAPSVLLAQHSQTETLQALKIESPIRLDGVLDEPAWAIAQHISNFTQRELNENAPATERTEVAVLYSQTELYIGVWCFDAEPDKIAAQKMKWDFEYGVEDNFEIVLDTYHDKRNAYLLIINPNGAQYDALVVDNSRRTNVDWNGVWYVAAKRTNEGWFAEIKIPFSTLKFSVADEQTWGINFERNIRRKREQILWQGWSRDALLVQVNRAGTLTGLQGLTRTKIFEFRPYALAGVEKEVEAPAATVGSLGLDFDYLINPTVKLDFTIHPDFAQVESDDLIVNLTRFSIRLPEKRQFFLESQNFFDFPLGQARPFYSRRIGIYKEQETPILAGARFLGKMGRTTLGAMDVQTGSTDIAKAANFSLVRWKQDLGEQSSVGALAIGEVQSGRFNGTGGVDALYSTSKLFGNKNFQIGGAFSATYTSDRKTQAGSAQRLFFSYPNDLIELSASWERVGLDFNPEVGFLSRTNYQLYTARWRINPRPRFLPWVQKLQFKPLEINYYIDDRTHQMQSVYTEFRPLGVFFKSGEKLEINFQRNAENLTEDFEIRPGYVIPPGQYWTNRGEIQFDTFEGRPLVLGAGVNWGEFYDGSSTEWSADLGWKPSRYYGLGLSYQRSDIRLQPSGFAIDEIVGRLNFSLTPMLYCAIFAQWNNDANEIRFNFRATWIPKPGAYIYFVLNEFGDTFDPHWQVTKTVAMIKFVWYLAAK